MPLVVFALVLLAATLHALWNFAARRVSGHFGVLWLGLCVASVLSWPLALLVHRAEPITLQAWPYILATGLLHVGYFIVLARAYGTGEISLVYPVARGSGVGGTALVGLLVLGETISLPGLLGMVLICLGTALIGLSQARHKDHMAAYLQALEVGAIIMAYSVTDNLAVQHINPIIYISGMFSVTAVLVAPYALLHHPGACADAVRHFKTYIGFIGIGSMVTYLLILFAFRLGPMSHIVAVRESSVVIASLLGFLVLKERCTVQKVLGIAAITLGLVLMKIA